MLGLAGDNLAIDLFFASLAATFAVAAVSQAGWKHWTLVVLLFSIAALSLVAAFLLPLFKDTYPIVFKYTSIFASSPIAWFATILFGLGGVLFINWNLRARTVAPEPIKIKSGLVLYYDTASDHPMAKRTQNIWRWYSLKNTIVIFDENSKKTEVSCTNLFLIFHMPVAAKQIIVKTTNIRYEVKDFGPRHAVICFFTDIMEGRVEVIVVV